MGHSCAVGHVEGNRLAGGFHLRADVGGYPGEHSPIPAATTPAAGALRTGYEPGDQGRGQRRRPRGNRGRSAAGAPDVHHPGQPSGGGGQGRQPDVRPPRRDMVGHRHGVRVGFEEVRVLGVEPDDRMASAIRRPGGDDLLARGTQERLHLQPTQSPARPPRSPR